MTWLGPDEDADPGGRRGRWIYPALAYTLLAGSTVVAAALDGVGPRAMALVGVAALWLVPLWWLFPRKDTHRPAVIVHYAGLVLVSGLLIRQSGAFTAFASIGYPLAVALFPARALMLAFAATAVAVVVGQTRSPDQTLSLVALGVAVPLLLAGWRVGAESERRERANRRLQEALAENADLHARLVTQAREAGMLDERRRLAQEIHDTLAQDLVALITQLRAAQGAPAQAGRRHLDVAASLATRALSEARRSVRALRPAPLEGSRLPEALAELAARWAETTGTAPAVEVTGIPLRLVAGVEVTLYRVAQEALANVARHARAERVGITLSYLDDTVLLDIRDDGRGFAVDSVSRGFGLESMRRRVHGIGGTLSVESAPGDGTAVAAAVPLIPADPGDPDSPEPPTRPDLPTSPEEHT